MADVSYVPGSMTAMAGDGCLALVDAPPDSPGPRDFPSVTTIFSTPHQF
jgi:hypothetical protein